MSVRIESIHYVKVKLMDE